MILIAQENRYQKNIMYVENVNRVKRKNWEKIKTNEKRTNEEFEKDPEKGIGRTGGNSAEK